MPDVLARATRVTKRFGEFTAVDAMSLDIPAGQLLGLLGPNGAGKTTLVNLFTGLRRPTSGQVEIAGGSPGRPAVRRALGMTPQDSGLPPKLRVRECVEFVAAHYPDPLDPDEVIERFGLAEFAHRQAGGLSGGQSRRVAVALAFVGRPRIVFLDEPTTGLDVQARHALWDSIKSFHMEGGTVVLTSHYLEEVEALAERVVVIDRGRIIADGSLAEIRGRVSVKRVTIGRLGWEPKLKGVVSIRHEGAKTHLLTTDSDELVRALVASGASLADLEVTASSLSDAFLAITNGAER